MLELFFLLFAGAVQSAAGAGGASPPPSQTELTAIPQIAVPQTEAPASPGVAPPTFLAPTDNAAVAPPTFLAPTDDAAVAPPTFLAPTDNAAVAPPTFLAPTDNAAVAPPTFLAPTDNAAAAPPAFLAPTDNAAAPAPAFLAPQQPALVAEPQVVTGRFLTALEVKPILSATKGNWIAVREYEGKDLLYVTHIWSWRCGLLEMKVGLNGLPPETWDLPPCHEDQSAAAAILPSDGLPFREFALGSIQQIEVHLTYDDLSRDQVRLTRLGTVIP